jgi:uncharacterized protein (TIGR02145 family)
MKNLFALLLCICTAFSLYSQAPNANWEPDWDGDNQVGVSDLLGLLGVFGDVDTDGDGIWDSVDLCSDSDACNFNATPTAVCQFLDAIGICGGDCESDSDGDGLCDEFNCGAPLQYFDHYYATVLIDQQCWFAENLRTTFYQNGDSILTNQSLEQWQYGDVHMQGICAVYGEGSMPCYDDSPEVDACDSDTSLQVFGRYYNWWAVSDERNLCPSGWHVANVVEWNQLIETIGGFSVAGSALKSTSTWDGLGNGSNSSGFNVVAAGTFNLWGNANSGHAGRRANFWTSSTYNNGGNGAEYMTLSHTSAAVESYGHGKSAGFSVRCLKD